MLQSFPELPRECSTVLPQVNKGAVEISRNGTRWNSSSVPVIIVRVFRRRFLEQSSRIRPSLWNCLWGLPFLLVGMGLFLYTIIHDITSISDSLTQVVVPGRAELTLQAGRTYLVFLEDQSVVDGKVYSTTESIEGLSCHVRSMSTGQIVKVTASSMNTSYTVDGRSGHSVLQFHIQDGGKYDFACDYGGRSTGPEVVLAVGTGVTEGIFRTVLVSLAAFFGGGATCMAWVLCVVIKHERAKKLQRQLTQVQGV